MPDNQQDRLVQQDAGSVGQGEELCRHETVHRIVAAAGKGMPLDTLYRQKAKGKRQKAKGGNSPSLMLTSSLFTFHFSLFTFYRKPVLQRSHRQRSLAQGPAGFHGGLGGRQGRNAGH